MLSMTAEQRIRESCIALLGTRDDEALMRLVPQFREAVEDFEAKLKARNDGPQQKREKRSA